MSFRLLATLILIVASVVTSCAPQSTVNLGPKPTNLTSVGCVVVLPSEVVFRESQAWDTHEKTLDLVEAVGGAFPVVILALDDYAVAGTDNVVRPASQTDAATKLRPFGVEPSQCVAVRFSLVESWGESRTERSLATGGSVSTASIGESEVRFQASVMSFSTGAELISFTVPPTEPEWPEHYGADLRPDITAFARANFAALVDLMRQNLPFRSWPQVVQNWRPKCASNPLELMDVETPGKKSMRITVGLQNEFERENMLRDHIEYRYPELDRMVARQMASDPIVGVYLLADWPCAGLKQGDVIKASDVGTIRRDYHLTNLLLSPKGLKGHKLMAVRGALEVVVEPTCGCLVEGGTGQ